MAAEENFEEILMKRNQMKIGGWRAARRR